MERVLEGGEWHVGSGANVQGQGPPQPRIDLHQHRWAVRRNLELDHRDPTPVQGPQEGRCGAQRGVHDARLTVRRDTSARVCLAQADVSSHAGRDPVNEQPRDPAAPSDDPLLQQHAPTRPHEPLQAWQIGLVVNHDVSTLQPRRNAVLGIGLGEERPAVTLDEGPDQLVQLRRSEARVGHAGLGDRDADALRRLEDVRLVRAELDVRGRGSDDDR